MGRLPYLTTAPKETSRQVGNFLGLNTGTVIQENEFADMKNMSSRDFPAISTRRTRGEIIKTLGKPHGLHYKNGLAYVDGTGLYYKDEKIADVTDTDKQIIGIGAYLVVFPDKIMYNTSTKELTSLEAKWTQSSNATFAQTTTGSTMVKITCTGIGKKFSQFDGVEITGCTNDAFNKTTVIQEITDDYLVIIGDLDKTFTQASGLSISRKVPDMDYICENGNRVWGCSSVNHEIYASKLGDPANWNAFEGISTDSYAATIGSDGDFTGCLSHMGYTLFFKEDSIHTIMGDKPSNFQITTVSPARGIAKGCEGTACVVDETLIYAARNCICSYDGANPSSISDVIGDKRVSQGVAGQYDGKYYASLERDGEWSLYVYDMEKSLWHKEDDLHIRFMSYGEGELYYIDTDGNLSTIAGDRKETVEWAIESGDMLDGSVEYKHLKRLLFHLKLDPGAEVDVLLKYDEEKDWEKAITYTASSYRTHVLNIVPRRCQKYRYRLEGRGAATLIAMGKSIGLGSERNGSI